MRPSQQVAKNLLAGGVGSGMGGVIQFVATLLIARQLGLRDFGIYALLATMMFMLNRLSEFGMSAILIRDIAVAPSKTSSLLAAALALAWSVVAVVALLAGLTVRLAPIEGTTALAAIMMGTAGLLQFPCACYGSVMRAREDLELDAVTFLIHKVALIFFVALNFETRLGLVGVATAYLAAALIQVLASCWIVRAKYLRPRLAFDFRVWRYLVSNAAPLGLSNALQLIAEQADVSVLAWFAGLSAAGLYTGAYKISIGLRFVPTVMVLAIFPIYSRAASAETRKAEFQELYQRGFKGFALLAFPMTIVMFLASKPLITVLLGQAFAPAASALKIIAPAAGLLFLASPVPYLLTALEQQKALLATSIIATAIRIFLLCIFVPYLGFKGACYALLISQIALVIMWERAFRTLGFALPPVGAVLKFLLACVPLGVVIILANPHQLETLAPVLLSGIALYCLAVWRLRVFTTDELNLARESLGFIRGIAGEKKPSLQRTA